MQERSRKIVRLLCIIWIVTFALFSLTVRLYTIHSSAVNGVSPLYLNSPLHLTVLGVCGLCFYPMLFVVRRHAQIAKRKKTMTVTTIGIVFFSCFLTANVLCCIGHLLALNTTGS